MDPDRPPSWFAEYTIESGADSITYVVPGTEILECPVSYITPRSQELVSILGTATHAQRATGASLFGPDLSKWPAKAVDASVCLELERISTDNARREAEG